MTPDYMLLIEPVTQIVHEAASTILLSSDYQVHDKGPQDLVTDLDFAMERAIKAALLEMYPGDAFIGEEENHDELGAGRTWVCDPIDGTVNFTQGIPYYGIQLALLVDRAPVFSLIHLPVLGETYVAVKGQGAFLNGVRLQSDPAMTLPQALVTFGDFSKSNPSSRGFQLKAMGVILSTALRVRIQGASSVDFAFVAAGRNSCHILFTKNIWELAPGLLMTKEAGCLTGEINGAAHGFQGQGLVIAANQAILDKVLEIFENIKNT